jgi:hypothetical protein
MNWNVDWSGFTIWSCNWLIDWLLSQQTSRTRLSFKKVGLCDVKENSLGWKLIRGVNDARFRDTIVTIREYSRFSDVYQSFDSRTRFTNFNSSEDHSISIVSMHFNIFDGYELFNLILSLMSLWWPFQWRSNITESQSNRIVEVKCFWFREIGDFRWR